MPLGAPTTIPRATAAREGFAVEGATPWTGVPQLVQPCMPLSKLKATVSEGGGVVGGGVVGGGVVGGGAVACLRPWRWSPRGWPEPARLEEGARAALHEELAVRVDVVRVRALPALALAEEQRDDAAAGELLPVRGAVGAEEVLGAVVLVALTRRIALLSTLRWFEFPSGICHSTQRLPDFTFHSRSHSAYRLKLLELIDAVSLASHHRSCPERAGSSPRRDPADRRPARPRWRP